MSSKNYGYMHLVGGDVKVKDDDLRKQFYDILNEGLHGICFSPYVKGQKPGDKITEEQIRERLEIIRPYTKWIRTFSCTEGNELIPKIAKEMGLKTLVGAWIGKEKEKNDIEVENTIKIAKEGYVDILAIGNEVMLRGDVTEDELIEYINRAKAELPNIEVGYVDAYYEFEEKPRIADACDVILSNCYPFWEGCAREYALPYMKDMYARAKKAGKGKKVIITETGWPNIGSNTWGAIPSRENAMKYFIDTYTWAKEDNIEIFYFSTFDEDWKVADEGDVGAYWGIWNTYGEFKY
ncbi:MAG: glucan 1,3-beta-glucosidase [Fusobacteriaceae bacterium]|nr:glycosyl hydrolase [Fusobacteriales bacterium]MDN5305202.1 glucan 1,3-beta-glucosidase [Fusobacteriaceae bacterium]